MQEIQVTDIHQGVWIDRNWLQKAGLGDRLEIEMRDREICIRTARKTQERKTELSEDGWKIFRTLGDDAVMGCLNNASENHDQYLYGKQI